MIINIIDKTTFEYKDFLQVSSYEMNTDSEYAGKSEILMARKPEACEGDYVLLLDNGRTYSGIIDTLENEEGQTAYKINVLEMCKLFDQKIILASESLLKTGIEDFVANQIRSNFIASSDAKLNKAYLSVTCKSHTPVEAAVETENGIYNLCTYMGNALTNYGIFTDFQFSKDGIEIVLEKKAQTSLDIDTKVSDVMNLVETYKVDALAKLTVLWKTSEEATATQKMYFLKTDRTVTTNINDPDRAEGTSDCVAITAETEAAMYQEVLNQFKSNSYQHKIEFDVIGTSMLVPASELYVGNECRVKTKAGIKNSIITSVSRASNSSKIHISLGQLKITLIDKLKAVIK